MSHSTLIPLHLGTTHGQTERTRSNRGYCYTNFVFGDRKYELWRFMCGISRYTRIVASFGLLIYHDVVQHHPWMQSGEEKERSRGSQRLRLGRGKVESRRSVLELVRHVTETSLVIDIRSSGNARPLPTQPFIPLFQT
jgi:hypothetical protein